VITAIGSPAVVPVLPAETLSAAAGPQIAMMQSLHNPEGVPLQFNCNSDAHFGQTYLLPVPPIFTSLTILPG
jgi:hypothetical protein